MRLRNWLLTGTSIGLMALVPLTVRAQDGDLVAAYQAYAAAQASGDAAALEAAQATLTELCIVSGYASLEECIAAISAASAPPAATEEPAPAEEPMTEEPVAEEPVAEEVAPEPEMPAEEPVVEEPTAEEPVAEEPAAEEPAAEEPVAEEPAAEEPVVEEPVMEEPAPEVVEEAPAEEPAPEPVAEEPAAEQPAEAPAEEAAPQEQAPDISAQLQTQLDIYNAAIADMMAGGDPAAARSQMDAALAEISALCAQAGTPDVTACLAAYGLALPAVPSIEQPAPEAPVEEPAAEQPPAEDAAPETPVEEPAPELPAEEPAAEAPAEEPAAEQPAAEVPAEQVPAEQVEPVEDLPEGVTEEQVAPVLDSAKDEDVSPEAEAELEAEVAAEPVAPPPASDADAQVTLEVVQEGATISAVEEQGEVVQFQEVAPPAVSQNVTIINQTNVVNNVTNNNTTVNVDNSTTNIGQQNNVAITPPPAPGEAITQVILQIGTQLVVNSIGQDTDRFYNPQEDEIYYENLSNGRVREVITRPDGTQIVTIRNRNGDVLRRSRITPDGREYVLAYFDDRYSDDLIVWRDPAEDLPPLRLNIPVTEYVLDAQYADEEEVEVFFRQPPVEQVARLYSIDEVKRSARIRDSVRKLEVGGLTFDTGAATIGRDQVGALSAVANAMLALLEQNPGETFLIEGHTDAVGSEISNLQLSDLRAATVARILTDFYGVPPENLATQGYGERYLKIRTEAAERENRRVTIRRITPLITVASN